MSLETRSKNTYGPEKYKEILLRNGISDPVENVKIESINMGGDGFASFCESVTVTFKDEKRPPLSLFVKKQVQNEEFAKQLNEVGMYEREHNFFSILLPNLLQFAKEKPRYDGFLENVLPKCYYADGYLLALENLKTKGFVIFDRKIPHGLEQAKLCLDAIARVHAATYALIKDIGLDQFQSKYPFVHERNTWSEAGITANGPWLQMPVDGAIKVLKARPTPGSDGALNFFSHYETDAFLKIIPNYRLGNPSCGTVVNHGDYWHSNIMFGLHPETKAPQECVIIDWQTTHLGSPALDIQFYLFFVLASDVRRKELSNLLRFYYDAFKGYASQLGQESIFTYEELEEDIRNNCEVGFIFAMYNIFGIEALSQVGDVANEEGSVLTNLTSTMINGLDRLMDEKGEKYSREIVEAFEEFQNIRSS